MYTHLIISQWDSCLCHLLVIESAYSNVSDLLVLSFYNNIILILLHGSVG